MSTRKATRGSLKNGRMYRLAVAGVLGALGLGSPLQKIMAANGAWTGGSNGNWDAPDTGNWVGGVVPGSSGGTSSADTATFNATSSFNSITVANNWNIANITFDVGTGSYTIGTNANVLQLSSGGTIQITDAVTAAVAETIAAPVKLNGNYTLTNDSGNAATTLSFSGNFTVANNTTPTITLDGANTGINLISGTIANSNGQNKTSLLKSDVGTWVFSGANSFTGGVTITGGILGLDFSQTGAPTTNIINSGNSLTLGGGTLNVKGKGAGTNSQTFSGVTISAGASAITTTQNGASSLTVTLGALTRSVGGTIDFMLPTTGTITTSSTDTHGMLGGYATVNGTDWAHNNGTSIVAATYTNDAWASANNTTVTTSNSPTSGSTTNSLRFNNAGAYTVTLAGTNIISSGGILVTGNVGNNASLITGGTLEGASGSDLVVIQNNTANTMTIASTIANNGSATGLTKSGAGSLILNGNNNYTGATTVNAGILQLGAGKSLNSGSALNTNGAGIFDLNGNTQSPNLVNNNGTITNTGAATTLNIGDGSTGSGKWSGNMNVAWTQHIATSSLGGTWTNTGTINFTENSNGSIASTGAVFNNTGAITFNTTSSGTITITNASFGGTGNISLTSNSSGTITLANCNITTTGNISLSTASSTAYSLSGGTVNNSGTITNSGNGSNATSISASVGSNVTGIIENATPALNVSGELTVNSAGTTLTDTSGSLTLSGGVGGTGNLILSNNSGTSGGVTLSTSAVNNSGTITNQGTGSGSSTISGGVGANVTGITENSTSSQLDINTTGLTVAAGGTTLTNSNASGSKLLTLSSGVSGTGNLILANNSGIANGITISATSVNNVGAITNSGSGTGNTLISAPIGSSVTGINQTGASPLTISGAVTLGSNMTIASSGTGLTTLSGGITGAHNLVLNANDGGGITLSTNSVNNGGTITNSGTSSGTTTISAVIGASVTGVVENSSASTLILSGVNTYTSGTTVTSGLLQMSGSGTLGTSSSDLTVNGGTLDLNGTSQSIDALNGTGGTILNNSTGTSKILTIGSNNTGGTYSGTIADHGTGTGTVALTKSGSGTEVLSGANIYSGVTSINAGALNVASGETAGTSGPLGKSTAVGSIVFGGGTLQYSAANTYDYSGRFSTAASQPISVDTNGQNVTFASPLTSSGGSLTKLGLGTLTLSGANTFTGTTTINAGTLSVGNVGTNGNLGNASTAIGLGSASTTATLSYTGASATLSRPWTLGTAGGEVDVTAPGTNLTLSGAITNGTGTFTVGGVGTVTLNSVLGTGSGGLLITSMGLVDANGANTYTGPTTINAGTLNVATLAAVNTTSSIGKGSSGGSAADMVINGGTLRYTGSTAASTNRLFSIGTSGATLDASGTGSGTLSFTGTTALGFNSQTGARTLTLTGSNTGANTLAAIIADDTGATSLNKSGAGSWTLSGANTYSGVTTISGGTLKLSTTGNNNINSSSKILVGGTLADSGVILDVSGVTGSGGFKVAKTLAGFGTVSGSTTISSGGVVNPGDVGVVGTLRTGAFTFSSGAVFGVDLSGSTGTNTADELVINGSATATGVTLTFNPLAGTGAMTAGNYALATATSGTGLTSSNFTSTTIPANYRLLNSNGVLELDLTHKADQTITNPLALGRVMVNQTLSGQTLGTLNNTAPTGSASLVTTSLTASGTGLTFTGVALASGTTVSGGSGTNIVGTIATGTTTGNLAFTVSNTDSNAVMTTATNSSGSVTVLNNRAITVDAGSSVALGRVMIGNAVSGSGNVVLTSTGSDSNFTRITVGDGGTDSNGLGFSVSGGTPTTVFNGTTSDTRSLSGGTFTTTGAKTGTVTLANGNGETSALSGQTLGSTVVSYTATALDNRTITVNGGSSVNLGRVMVNKAVVASGNVALSSAGSDSNYTRITVANGGADSSSLGFTVSGGTPTTVFNGTTSDTRNLTGGTFTSTGAKSGTVTLSNGNGEAGLLSGQTLGSTLVSYSATAVENRVVTASSIDLGRFIAGQAVGGSSTLSTTGDDSSNTRVTVNGTLFNAANVTSTYTLASASYAVGPVSGAVDLTVTGEGLAGEGVYSPVVVSYSGTAVNQRVVTASALNFGRFMSSEAQSGVSTLSTSGDDNSNTRVTVNGTVFDSATSTGTYAFGPQNFGAGAVSGSVPLAVTGEGLAGENLVPVSVSYSGTSVGQRVVTASGIDLGRFMSSQAVGGSSTLSTTGDDNSKTRVTVNGTLFNAAGVTSTYTLASATYAGGAVSGSVPLTVTGEGLVGEGSYSPVNVTYSGTAVDNRVVRASDVSLGAIHVGGSSAAANSTLTTTGADSAFTRVTVNGTVFNGPGSSGTYTLASQSFGTVGNVSGSVTLTTTGEGLVGETPINVSVGYTATVYSGQGVWGGGAGSWNNWANWNQNSLGGVPGMDGALSANDTATFGDPASAVSVTLDGANPVLSGLTINSTSPYTLGQGSGGALTLANAAGVPVNITGNHIISAPVVLSDATTITTATVVDSLTISGAISGSGALTKAGAGLVSVQNLPANIVVTGGTLQLVAGTTHGLQTLSSLVVSGGTLDLTNHDLYISGGAGSLAALGGKVSTSTVGPTVNGDTILAIALMSGSDYTQVTRSTALDGQTVSSGDLVGRLAYAGDTNLDGVISADDYLALDVGYEFGLSGWVHGDFLGTGTITPMDFAMIDTNYLHQSGSLAEGEIAAHTAKFGAAYTEAFNLLNPVPEPTSLGLLAAGTLALLRRRRRGR